MKKNNNKGFTLAELLIVVAIIAVLTAVAVPVFTTQLEKSREATDIANLRAAKAEAVSMYLTGDIAQGNYYFDAQKGSLVKEAGEGTKGKGTATGNQYSGTDNEYAYTSGTDYRGADITVAYTAQATDGEQPTLKVYMTPDAANATDILAQEDLGGTSTDGTTGG